MELVSGAATGSAAGCVGSGLGVVLCISWSLFGGFPVIDWLVVLVVGCVWGFWLVVVLSGW